MGRSGRVTWYRQNFLLWEFVIALLVAAVFVAGTEAVWGRDTVITFLDGSRESIYGTVASLAGSLLGFILAGVSIILVFGQMNRFRLLRESGQYRTVFLVYFQGIQWFSLTTVVSLLALLWDTDRSPSIIATYLVFWLVVISAFRLYRCVWVLKEMTMIAVKPVTEAKDENAA